MQTLEIAVLAFNGISPFHLSVPCVVFEDRAGAGLPSYRLRICAGEAAAEGSLRTTAGFAVQTNLTLEDAAGADVLIVPSWRDARERPPAAMVQAVRDAYDRGATVVGLCLGAFVLAEAGVLDGREAATHWSSVQVFLQRYPRVKLVPDVLYVDADEGRLVTSAGTAAGLDCCLHLVRRWHGAEAANRVARRLVVAPHRQGGQAQYIEQPLHDAPGGDRLSDLLNWVAANLGEPHTLDSLASRAAMSRRNFTRRFRELTGTTVGQWLLGQRLAYAQRLLETTRQPVDVVAQRAGFGSAVSLREHFSQAYHTSPSAYRSVFAQA
ncbi:GlxA family transcriptional regulator [Candidimonas nitroreducens]|uniref:AraC family transcriptional regulator n=1 Tax=Candidimonas nitroreducens TaxID=683354 RepID=A0A225MHH6_9BURK|nr:helix-turn-helix domain-containing protein [Candidimonas nitroreducens]OWT58389.1 AraC family transcriptional regulator [Candidimonas nitroreducens]